MPKEKFKTVYVCTSCGEASPRWMGRCPSCGEWNTMVEDIVKETKGKGVSAPATGNAAIIASRLKDISTTEEHSRIITGISELDRVLGGGIVLGSVVLLGGEPGAGKSTLLNTLTGAGILAEDKLFATLDPTTRELKLPSGQEILLTDTVGFIRKLPHHLIEAFRSTLEEARYADIILHVVDAANPQMDEQMYIVYETLQNLGVTDKPIVTIFNKQDKAQDDVIIRDFHADYTVKISAKTREGIPELLKTIEAVLRQQKVAIENLYPYQDAAKIQMIRRFGELQEEEYREDGIFVRAYVPVDIYEKVKVSRGDSPKSAL